MKPLLSSQLVPSRAARPSGRSIKSWQTWVLAVCAWLSVFLSLGSRVPISKLRRLKTTEVLTEAELQWYIPVILAPERLRQEDQELESSLDSIVSLRLAWTTK